MKTLRMLHLYLGCVFAPMVLFFAISGLWQTFSLEWSKGLAEPNVLTYLSTIHTGNGLKVPHGPSTLYSPLMKWFIVAMVLSLIATMILGIIMAYKFGHKKIATICLFCGLAIPLGLVALTILR